MSCWSGPVHFVDFLQGYGICNLPCTIVFSTDLPLGIFSSIDHCGTSLTNEKAQKNYIQL